MVESESQEVQGRLVVSQGDKPWQVRLKEDVAKFCADTGMKHTTFGMKAIKNPRFWDNITNGGTCTVEKADEVYTFMAEQGHYFNS